MTSDAKGKLSDTISALITIRKSAEQVLFWQILVQSNNYQSTECAKERLDLLTNWTEEAGIGT